MTKARDIADFKFENIVDTGTEGTKIAAGTTAQRGSTAGQLRFNSDTGLAEYYTGAAFKVIDAPPTVSSLDVTEVDSQAGGNQTIVITGSGFGSGATVTFVGASGTDFNASTVTVDSTTQITAVAPKSSFLNAQEPYGVRVSNVSGLSGILASQINVDTAPSWTTASGSLGTVYEDEAISTITVAASDADGDTVSYSVQTGSLPTGLSLGSANGQITGTPNVNDTYASGGVTHNFTLRATANSKTSDRAFSILRKWNDGSSAAQAATRPSNLSDLGISTDGLYYLDPDGGGAGQFYVKFSTGGGYAMALAMRYANPFFYGQLMYNRWNGHSGQDGPNITTASTWNGTAASYIPDSATHVMLGWHNDITSSSPTDWVHAGIVGSSSSNTGHFATSSHNAAYSTTVVDFSVSGWSDGSNAQWHFRDMPSSGYDYYPRGISRGNMGHSTNNNATNDLLGAIADSCNSFTSQYGVATITNTSETYVGNRKDIDASGAGGSYCSVPSSGNNDGWTMWWR